MKKLFILLLIVSCSKTQPANSNEVLISGTNKCFCKITFYKNENYYTSLICDCEYTNIAIVDIETGKYKLVAKSNGSKKEMEFEKKLFLPKLINEF